MYTDHYHFFISLSQSWSQHSFLCVPHYFLPFCVSNYSFPSSSQFLLLPPILLSLSLPSSVFVIFLRLIFLLPLAFLSYSPLPSYHPLTLVFYCFVCLFVDWLVCCCFKAFFEITIKIATFSPPKAFKTPLSIHYLLQCFFYVSNSQILPSCDVQVTNCWPEENIFVLTLKC